MKLAIVSTHPIQYNAPWFKLLAQQPTIKVKVFYTWSQSSQGSKYDPGFNRIIEWDIPLLDGYDYEFINNVAVDPGSHHYRGIDNPSLNKDIEHWQADAILVLGWCFRSHLKCLKYFKGRIPVLFRGDSTLLDEKPGIKKIIRRAFLRYVYSYVDHAFYVGTNNRQYFLAHGLKPSQLHFAPHAIDNERFEGNETEYAQRASTWRTSLGLEESHLKVLFAGKLEQKKNPYLILELAKKITSDNIRFIIIGNGPLENDVKEKACNDKRIIFLDFQNQQLMPIAYRLGDVFVMPSTGPGETWGLAINEAMACGRAIIASDRAGGAVDLVRPNLNGYIINGNNANEAVRSVEKMMENRREVFKMGSLSKNYIQCFTFDAIVNKITSTLNQLN